MDVPRRLCGKIITFKNFFTPFTKNGAEIISNNFTKSQLAHHRLSTYPVLFDFTMVKTDVNGVSLWD